MKDCTVTVKSTSLNTEQIDELRRISRKVQKRLSKTKRCGHGKFQGMKSSRGDFQSTKRPEAAKNRHDRDHSCGSQDFSPRQEPTSSGHLRKAPKKQNEAAQMKVGRMSESKTRCLPFTKPRMDDRKGPNSSTAVSSELNTQQDLNNAYHDESKARRLRKKARGQQNNNQSTRPGQGTKARSHSPPLRRKNAARSTTLACGNLFDEVKAPVKLAAKKRMARQKQTTSSTVVSPPSLDIVSKAHKPNHKGRNVSFQSHGSTKTSDPSSGADLNLYSGQVETRSGRSRRSNHCIASDQSDAQSAPPISSTDTGYWAYARPKRLTLDDKLATSDSDPQQIHACITIEDDDPVGKPEVESARGANSTGNNKLPADTATAQPDDIRLYEDLVVLDEVTDEEEGSDTLEDPSAASAESDFLSGSDADQERSSSGPTIAVQNLPLPGTLQESRPASSATEPETTPTLLSRHSDLTTPGAQAAPIAVKPSMLTTQPVTVPKQTFTPETVQLANMKQACKQPVKPGSSAVTLHSNQPAVVEAPLMELEPAVSRGVAKITQQPTPLTVKPPTSSSDPNTPNTTAPAEPKVQTASSAPPLVDLDPTKPVLPTFNARTSVSEPVSDTAKPVLSTNLTTPVSSTASSADQHIILASPLTMTVTCEVSSQTDSGQPKHAVFAKAAESKTQAAGYYAVRNPSGSRKRKRGGVKHKKSKHRKLTDAPFRGARASTHRKDEHADASRQAPGYHGPPAWNGPQQPIHDPKVQHGKRSMLHHDYYTGHSRSSVTQVEPYFTSDIQYHGGTRTRAPYHDGKATARPFGSTCSDLRPAPRRQGNPFNTLGLQTTLVQAAAILSMLPQSLAYSPTTATAMGTGPVNEQLARKPVFTVPALLLLTIVWTLRVWLATLWLTVWNNNPSSRRTLSTTTAKSGVEQLDVKRSVLWTSGETKRPQLHNYDELRGSMHHHRPMRLAGHNVGQHMGAWTYPMYPTYKTYRSLYPVACPCAPLNKSSSPSNTALSHATRHVLPGHCKTSLGAPREIIFGDWVWLTKPSWQESLNVRFRRIQEHGLNSLAGLSDFQQPPY